MAEPRDLPFRELPAARLHLLDSLFKRRNAVQVGEHFLVPKGLRRFFADGVFELPQSAHFIDKTFREHSVNAVIDSVVNVFTGQIEPEDW